MQQATIDQAVKTPTVVLNDTSNVVFNNVPPVNLYSLTKIVSERKTWEANAYRSSNKQLYAILAKCYAYYLALGDKTTDTSKELRSQLSAFIETNNLRFTKSSHGITKVLKCVFYDGEKSIDRRRISTYSIVLRSALSQGISAEEVADFVERNGGVQEIRLAKSKIAKTPKQRAELGRTAIDQALVLATFRSDAVSQQIDSTDFDQPFVAVVVVRADGNVEVRSLIKSKGATNAALAAHYAAANDGNKSKQAA